MHRYLLIALPHDERNVSRSSLKNHANQIYTKRLSLKIAGHDLLMKSRGIDECRMTFYGNSIADFAKLRSTIAFLLRSRILAFVFLVGPPKYFLVINTRREDDCHGAESLASYRASDFAPLRCLTGARTALRAARSRCEKKSAAFRLSIPLWIFRRRDVRSIPSFSIIFRFANAGLDVRNPLMTKEPTECDWRRLNLNAKPRARYFPSIMASAFVPLEFHETELSMSVRIYSTPDEIFGPSAHLRKSRLGEPHEGALVGEPGH